MRYTRLLVSLSLLSAAALASCPALATPSFPSAIQSDLTLDFEPACSLCHEGGKTGNGTVTTPFGAAMLARGLHANDENSLSSALGKMMDDAVDSDADGVTDIDELTAGTDPNVAGAGKLAEGTAQYGCGAEVVGYHPSSNSGTAFLAAALTAVALSFRLRRKR